MRRLQHQGHPCSNVGLPQIAYGFHVCRPNIESICPPHSGDTAPLTPGRVCSSASAEASASSLSLARSLVAIRSQLQLQSFNSNHHLPLSLPSARPSLPRCSLAPTRNVFVHVSGQSHLVVQCVLWLVRVVYMLGCVGLARFPCLIHTSVVLCNLE